MVVAPLVFNGTLVVSSITLTGILKQGQHTLDIEEPDTTFVVWYVRCNGMEDGTFDKVGLKHLIKRMAGMERMRPKIFLLKVL